MRTPAIAASSAAVLGRELSGVVASVGDHHEDAPAVLRAARDREPPRAEPDRLAERRRVADQAGLDAFERLLHESVVDGERALGERVLAEGDQADPVAAARAHELRDGSLGELEPRHLPAVDLSVEREHAARGVERDQQIHAGAACRVLRNATRPGARRPPPAARARAIRSATETRNARSGRAR